MTEVPLPELQQACANTLLWAPWAWVGGRWREAVLLEISSQGHWKDIRAGAVAPPQAQVLAGPVLPGMVNAHSHAFQRAFAGLAERRASASSGASSSTRDDFWSWRTQMYGLAQRITPAEMRQIATGLYKELLHGGYTHVCEFHYLHHAPNGQPYADEDGGPLALSATLVQAAQDSGIGLTMLPVLYERAGFAQPLLREDQRRFRTDAGQVLALRDGVRAMARNGHFRCASTLLQAPLNAGVAIHSLRAARPEAINELVRCVQDDAGPLHIHIAEQVDEVNDCLAHTGQRPIEWLCNGLGQGFKPDRRWQLVHATHATAQEIDAVARSGAGLVLCPSTEANLGDGLTDLPRWLSAGVPMAIGSDSHVTRDWREELRWAEYGQRLLHRQRNVLAALAPTAGPLAIDSDAESATATCLFEQALVSGGYAAGQALWGLQVGARADLLVIDASDTALRGIPPHHLLDALVFSSPVLPFATIMVNGRWVSH